MKIFYTDHFVLPLPPNHRFPMEKYALLRERIIASDLMQHCELHVPDAATDQELALAHDVGYVNRVVAGTLTREEIRRIGFPWSPELVERSRRSVGATVAACRAALVDGVAVSLAGGTHHAAAASGEGFCVFNDTAVAIRVLQEEQRIGRVLVVDCDVHQGNGTSQIFAGDPSVFTFDMFGERNYPFTKGPSDLAVPMRDATGDAAYLEVLEVGVARATVAADAELAIYLAGADPFVGDRLGRLALSKGGLAARDRAVFTACRTAGLPVAVTMSGGYANDVTDTVDIHHHTIQAALVFLGQLGARS